MYGQRLRAARLASGLSLRGLSERLGNLRTPQALGNYERDQDTPPPEVISALADALRVPREYLEAKEVIALESVEFRAERLESKKEAAKVEGKVLYQLDQYLQLEILLDLPTREWQPPRSAPIAVEDPKDAELAGVIIRREWGLGIDPISDPMSLMEDRGIKVLALRLGAVDGIMGYVKRRNGSPLPVIVVSSEVWRERQWFNLAHELGHLVLTFPSSMPENQKEKLVHRFAGSFLMPETAVYEEIGRRRSSLAMAEILYLKDKFGLSAQAIVYRLRELGIINQSFYRLMWQEFDRLGWRTPPYRETLALPADRPKRFERLVFRAVTEKLVPQEKAAELLEISAKELQVLLEKPSALARRLYPESDLIPGEGD